MPICTILRRGLFDHTYLYKPNVWFNSPYLIILF